jgi:hypothetical protein
MSESAACRRTPGEGGRQSGTRDLATRHVKKIRCTNVDLCRLNRDRVTKPRKLFTIVCIAAAACVPLAIFAAGKSSPSVSASPDKGTRPLPFHGMIWAVDQDAKTFTLASKKMSRVFKITAKTVITKGPAPATVKDITVNQEASGSYWKRADGTLEAKNVKLGPMANPKSPTPSPAA